VPRRSAGFVDTTRKETEMKSLQRLVVLVLLGVWCFPAVSLAKPLPTPSAEVGGRASSGAAAEPPSIDTEGAALGAREKLVRDLQNFRGGGVYIYMGSGAAVVLVVVLLLLLF
jgi:hypothetical protein